MFKRAGLQPLYHIIVQIQLHQVHQAAEVVVEHRADVVERQVQYSEAGHAPEGMHPDLHQRGPHHVQLLQRPELLEDGADGQNVPVVVGCGDFQNFHAAVHAGSGDGVHHSALKTGHLALALLVLPAGALGRTESGSRAQPY